jgi:fucose permease
MYLHQLPATPMQQQQQLKQAVLPSLAGLVYLGTACAFHSWLRLYLLQLAHTKPQSSDYDCS